MKKWNVLSVGIIIFILTTFSPIFGQDNINTILVQVDGLSCPFCSYGLEKKLKNLDGVEKVEIHMRQGKAEMKVRPRVTISDESIKQAVEEAGFTPGTIERTESKDHE